MLFLFPTCADALAQSSVGGVPQCTGAAGKNTGARLLPREGETDTWPGITRPRTSSGRCRTPCWPATSAARVSLRISILRACARQSQTRWFQPGSHCRTSIATRWMQTSVAFMTSATKGGFVAIRDEAEWRYRSDPARLDAFVTSLSSLPDHHERATVTFLDFQACWKGATRFHHADRLAYWRKRKHLGHKPAAVVFVYSQAEGSPDLNFRGAPKAIEALQSMFAQAILKLDKLPPDPKDERVYDLDPLKSKGFEFHCQPASGIEKVVAVTACSVTPKGVHTCRESSSGFLRCSSAAATWRAGVGHQKALAIAAGFRWDRRAATPVRMSDRGQQTGAGLRGSTEHLRFWLPAFRCVQSAALCCSRRQ